MCGIAGIVSSEGRGKSYGIEVVNRMLTSMPWRGPDAEGVWGNDNVSFGHLRLSILDLSHAADQPMCDRFGNVIVFNGEIYNYNEIKKELISEYDFQTSSDTEVILAAYHRWGADCVSRFNGDWAFAIYDARVKSVFISRDRFGIKPLYYYRGPNCLYFASEIRTLLAAGVPGVISTFSCAKFFKFRQIEQRSSTMLEGILPVTPGCSMYIQVDSGEIKHSQYYFSDQLFSADVPKDETEAALIFGDLLSDAVKMRLNADVPVQIMLSGGLDSSAIAALSMQSSMSPVSSLSRVFPGRTGDESYYSDMVAAHLGTRHQRVDPRDSDFFDEFETVVKAQDFPTYSEKHVARHQLYREAARSSKVIIEGQGGDEVFGGYGRGFQLFRDCYEKDLGVTLLMVSPEKQRKSSLPRLGVLHQDVLRSIGKVRRKVDSIDIEDAYTKRQYAILQNNLLSLLHTGDRLQMYNSIEGRYPFLDHRVVELGMSMPVGFKMRTHDKYVLRVFLSKSKLLPETIVWRTDKKGFSTDFGGYLLQSPYARSRFLDKFMGGSRAFPNLFSIQSLEALLSEQYDGGINNIASLLAVYGLIVYLMENNIEIQHM